MCGWCCQRLLTVPSLEESLRPVPASAAPNLQEWVAEVPLAYPEKEVDPADAAAQGEGGAAAAAADDSDDSGTLDTMFCGFGVPALRLSVVRGRFRRGG